MEKYEIRDGYGKVLTTDFSNAVELDIFTNALNEYEHVVCSIREVLLQHPSETLNYKRLLAKLDILLQVYHTSGYKTDAIIYIASHKEWFRR